MLNAIKRFLTAPWRAAELEHELAKAQAVCVTVNANLSALEGAYGDLQRRADAAPSFHAASIRDDKFGVEIAEEVRRKAVEQLAPALSRQYMSILAKIAWTLPKPYGGERTPPGTVLSAMESKSRVYHVRVELPPLNFDMQIASMD